MQKEGANQGREFFACSKPREQSCRFFQWADENAPPAGSSVRVGTRCRGGRGGGGGRGGRGGATSGRGNADAGTKRKCGHCRQEGEPTSTYVLSDSSLHCHLYQTIFIIAVGHTKKKCPELVS